MTSFDQREHISTCMRLPIDFDKERALDEVRSIPVEMFSQISRGPTHKDVRSVFIKGYPPRLMENSMAPRGSIYARGKPVPNQSMVERAIIR